MAGVEQAGSPQEEKHLNGELLLEPEEREGAAGPGTDEGAKKKRRKKKKSRGAGAGASGGAGASRGGREGSGAVAGSSGGGGVWLRRRPGGRCGARPPAVVRRGWLGRVVGAVSGKSWPG